ncbi:hypothetical protein HPB51_002857 [Rhipicephalus microplus]|uniref:Ion transport domain-containing protein n=1 Tax=Rhipicephalus microplus TaxID=6941 RepID=A0A9J6EWQ4_RHIMP|nr:hypothetical protein HPB51_002857 [Rhipicephalus microplus]
MRAQTFCAIGKKLGGYHVYRFNAAKSFGCLGPLHPVRKLCVRLVTSQYLDMFVLALVLLNTLMLALKYRNLFLDSLFLALFTIDIGIRAAARGFVMHKYSYLSELWNCLDFVVTCAGAIELFGAAVGLGAQLQILNSFRPFRLFKVLTVFLDAVVEGSGNFDHLGFFNVHPNLSTRAYNISASIGNAAVEAGS